MSKYTAVAGLQSIEYVPLLLLKLLRMQYPINDLTDIHLMKDMTGVISYC